MNFFKNMFDKDEKPPSDTPQESQKPPESAPSSELQQLPASSGAQPPPKSASGIKKLPGMTEEETEKFKKKLE